MGGEGKGSIFPVVQLFSKKSEGNRALDAGGSKGSREGRAEIAEGVRRTVAADGPPALTAPVPGRKENRRVKLILGRVFTAGR